MGLEKQELAALVGIKPSYMTQIEQGIKPSTWYRLFRFAHVLGVSADYILGMDENAEIDTNSLVEMRRKLFSLIAQMKGEEFAEDLADILISGSRDDFAAIVAYYRTLQSVKKSNEKD